jgi:hypothetical protein
MQSQLFLAFCILNISKFQVLNTYNDTETFSKVLCWPPVQNLTRTYEHEHVFLFFCQSFPTRINCPAP